MKLTSNRCTTTTTNVFNKLQLVNVIKLIKHKLIRIKVLKVL